MRSLWQKFQEHQEPRFLKNWPRRRKQGKARFMISVTFTWVISMLIGKAIYDFLASIPYLTHLDSSLFGSIIGGIAAGHFMWKDNEKSYNQLTESERSPSLDE